MNVKAAVTDFFLTGVIVLVLSLIVTYLYSLLAHGSGLIDWETSIRLAIILGIVLPLSRQMGRKKGM